MIVLESVHMVVEIIVMLSLLVLVSIAVCS